MTTPETPYGQQPQNTTTTPPQQQAYRRAAPEQPVHDRARYPQQYGRPQYGEQQHGRQTHGRHGQVPQQGYGQPQAHGQPSGPHAFGPQGQGQPPAGYPRPAGQSGPQWVSGHTGSQQRVPGNSGPQQVPGRYGAQIGDDRSGYPQAPGYPAAPQQTATATAQQAPAYARDAREISVQPNYGRPAGLPAHPAAAAAPTAPKNGLGTTALVLGIIGALFAFIPIIGMIAWPLVILGLVFGIIGIARTRSGKADNRGVAISGTVLSAIGLIICIVWASAFSAAVSTTSPAGTTGSSAPAASAGTGGSADPAAFPGATSNDITGKAGDMLTIGDMQVTATALEPGDATFGNTLCSTVTYKNTGSSSASFSGLGDWKLQDPSGAALMTGLTGSTSPLSTGELAAGGTTSGPVCFDRPTASAGQYVLLFQPMMSFSSDRGAWLNQVG